MINYLALRSKCFLTRKCAFLTQTGVNCLILALVLLHAQYNTYLAVLLHCYSIGAMAIVARDVRRWYGAASIIQLMHIGLANSPLQVDWLEAGFKVD